MDSQYELVIRGEVGDRFGVVFEGMRLERDRGFTTMTGWCATRPSCTA